MDLMVGIIGFIIFILLMAVGVLFGRKPIAGSCGGLANVGLNGECKICGKTPTSCDPNQLGQDAATSNLSKKGRAAPDPLDF